MKKLLTLSATKIFIVCGLGLTMTLGGFWHYQMNQSQIDRINILNQGVTTCFNRISQTFTAMMIRDMQSAYLHDGFMGLSDECLSETINGINPFRKNVGRGYETLNQLMSETRWFHEKVRRMTAPVGADKNMSLAPLSDRYSKMENFKLSLIDEIDNTTAQLHEIQRHDEFLMGSGLAIFIVALSLLSLQEFNRLALQKEVERESMSYLKAGEQVGAVVDRLVDRALRSQNMPVTAKIFRDYHEAMLEKRTTVTSDDSVATEIAPAEEIIIPTPLTETIVVAPVNEIRTSLMEVLVNIQNIHQDIIQLNDVRDVQLTSDFEGLEQMLNAAVSTLVNRSGDGRKIMVTNQIHADRSVINLFLGGATFNASEMEFASGNIAMAEGMDMNMIVLKEMVALAGAQWVAENKTDKSGKITGLCMRFVINRASKMPKNKNLISLIRGKKKDIAAEMLN
jgi:hypothetical protein